MARRNGGLWLYNRTEGGDPPYVPPPFTLTVPAAIPPAQYTIYVGDHEGAIIGELQGALDSVAWRVDGYGTAALLLAPETVEDAPALIEFGNRVLIEFDNGLPPWGGVIDPPLEMATGQARLQLYQAAYMLTWRLTPRAASYEALAAAAVIADLVAAAELGIDAGNTLPADEQDEPLSVSFTYETVAAAVGKARELDPALHWYVEARPSTARAVSFRLRMFRDALADHTQQAVLLHGHNLVETTTLNQGPIVNETILAAGDADLSVDYAGAGEGSLEGQGGDVNVVRNVASRQRYDLRQEFVTLADVTEDADPGRAYRAAAARSRMMAQPRLRIQGTALNLEPALYRNYGIGSRVMVEMAGPSPLYKAVTVIGMEFTPGAGTLSLVFDDADRMGVA